MARKSSPPGRAVPPAKGSAVEPADAKKAPTLATLRGEIDRLDKELVTILNRRASIATQIGQVKHINGLEVWSAAREDEVLAKVLGASQGPLPQDTPPCGAPCRRRP